MYIGQVVKIISPTHKYYNEKAVIQFGTSKMFMIRLLNKKKPIYTRFLIRNNKLGGTLSSQINMYIKMSSIKPIKGKKLTHKQILGKKKRENF